MEMKKDYLYEEDISTDDISEEIVTQQEDLSFHPIQEIKEFWRDIPNEAKCLFFAWCFDRVIDLCKYGIDHSMAPDIKLGMNPVKRDHK